MFYDKSVSVSLPDLIQLARRAKELSFHTKNIRALNAGQHLSRLLGRGMEFAETRGYQAGDDIRTIDWRVTARTGKAHTKLFADEKERQVYVCADLRRPMFFATQGVFKSVQAATMAGYIAWNAVHEGNRVGGLIFNDQSTVECKPARGNKGALQFLHSLSEFTMFSKEKMEERGSTTMDDAISKLMRLVRPGSLVFILSDFRRPAARMEEFLYQIAGHSDVILGFVYDDMEEALPESNYLAVTNGDKELQLNTHLRRSVESYKKHFAARKEMLQKFNHHRRIHLLSCSTQDDCFAILRK